MLKSDMEAKRVYEIDVTFVVGWSDDGHGLTDPNQRGGFIVGWSCKDVGYGELTIVMKPDGMIEMDTETMSDEFVDALFIALRKKLVRSG